MFLFLSRHLLKVQRGMARFQQAVVTNCCPAALPWRLDSLGLSTYKEKIDAFTVPALDYFKSVVKSSVRGGELNDV